MKLKSMLAVGSTLLLTAGLMTLGVTSASATDSNQPDFWENQTGEVCTDVGYQTDDSATQPYTLPAAADGLTYSKVVVKAGSNNGNSLPAGVDENTVYTTGLTAGATFVHETKGSISHVIICTVPATVTLPPEPPTPPTVQECTTTSTAPVSTNIDQAGWGFTESRTLGFHEYVENGLRVWTTGPDLGQSKSAGYVPVNFPLAHAGNPSMDYTATNGASAGLNLSITVDGAWAGNLVMEPLYEKYWGSRAIPGVPAGPNSYQKAYGTLNEILADSVGHDIQVVAVGYSLGSGAIGDGIVNSITAGCVTYTFDHVIKMVAPEQAAYTDTCGVANDSYTRPVNTADVHYTVKDNRDSDGVGTVVIKAQAQTDRAFPKGTTRNQVITFTNEDCPVIVPDQPKDIVSTVTESATECVSRTVTAKTITTTIKHNYVEESNSWVESKPVITTTSITRDATAEECPIPAVVVPPITVVPTITTPKTQLPTPEVLASTGAPESTGWLGLGALGLLLLGGAALVLGGRRKVTE